MKLLMAARHRLEISYRPLTPWVDPDRMTEKCLMVFSVCCAPARNGVIYPVDMFLGRKRSFQDVVDLLHVAERP